MSVLDTCKLDEYSTKNKSYRPEQHFPHYKPVVAFVVMEITVLIQATQKHFLLKCLPNILNILVKTYWG